MAKVALIKPPIFISSKSLSPINGIPSLSLACLAGALKGAGHTVTCIDGVAEGLLRFRAIEGTGYLLHGLSCDEVVDLVPPDTTLIGVSSMFSNEWPSHKELLYKLRSRFPTVPIVIGGENATAQPDFIFKSTPFIDACALGEGEETVIELAHAVEVGEPFDDIRGLAIWRDGRVIRTADRPRIQNVSAIPDPDWSSLRVEKFMDRGLGLSVQNRRAIPMLASRGCPFQCTFCSSPGMWGTRFYARSPRRVVDEIKRHVAKYRIEHVDFCDLVGVINRDWLTEFCNLLIEERPGVSWVLGSGTRSEILDPAMLDLMKKSNILRIQYSPETGSEETAKRIKKRVNLKKLETSMRYAAKIGITTRANVIFGFPGQKKREVFASSLFSLRLAAYGINDVVFVPFAPYPGSVLHSELVEAGKIPDFRKDGTAEFEAFLARNSHSDAFTIKSYSEYYSSRFLVSALFLSTGIFYAFQFLLRPGRILATLKRVVYERRPLTFFDTLMYTLFLDRVFGRKSPKESVPAEPLGRSKRAGELIAFDVTAGFVSTNLKKQ